MGEENVTNRGVLLFSSTMASEIDIYDTFTIIFHEHFRLLRLKTVNFCKLSNSIEIIFPPHFCFRIWLHCIPLFALNSNKIDINCRAALICMTQYVT